MLRNIYNEVSLLSQNTLKSFYCYWLYRIILTYTPLAFLISKLDKKKKKRTEIFSLCLGIGNFNNDLWSRMLSVRYLADWQLMTGMYLRLDIYESSSQLLSILKSREDDFCSLHFCNTRCTPPNPHLLCAQPRCGILCQRLCSLPHLTFISLQSKSK